MPDNNNRWFELNGIQPNSANTLCEHSQKFQILFPASTLPKKRISWCKIGQILIIIISHIELCTFRQKISNKKKRIGKNRRQLDLWPLDRAHIWITELIDFVFTFGCVCVCDDNEFSISREYFRCFRDRWSRDRSATRGHTLPKCFAVFVNKCWF